MRGVTGAGPKASGRRGKRWRWKMGTKTLSVAALGVGTVALILAIVALLSGPEGADDVRREVAGLETRMGELGEDVAGVSSAVRETPVKLANLSRRTETLESRVASLVDRPAAEPAPQTGGAEVDAEGGEEKLRELVREEMQAQVRTMMERFRGGMGGQGGRRGRGVTAESLKGDLGLDEEKAASVVELRRKVSEGIRNIWRENRDGDRAQNIELMNELRRKTDEEIAKLLTPEQLEKYKALSDRGRGRRGRGRDRDRRNDNGGEQPEGHQRDPSVF